ncbi:Gfo/Idh/MocA family oxidoreductase [Modestobacter sp. VKM Ac-2977]|uniref:Gfo/Idh/MocA family protein n=1 Tax=Modestobacter sp. VKM Ac-2977 TaxID=3004131 RepID=UPI0022AB0151|nr:Gfo/Idh/MocA family oxidoreductase [Modestobacter sp. VKM Ac-2977]MCZ2820362.1 Gfo/Idh/MocA family oxidoreductase [Modestobacter sp. VKM Ac-2977]
MTTGDAFKRASRLHDLSVPNDATRRPLIGVGVVGLSATGGWGAGGHLPALSTVGGFELRGLVGSSPTSARAASGVHGVPAYASAGALAEADDIDLVVVAVKTPQHRDLVLPALDAGKPVFCEWPFAVTLQEAEEMAAAAQGLPTFVGLQGRSSPTFRWLADLVSNGFVGEVLSVTVTTAATEWGTPVSERMLYTLDRQLGATMMAIAFGHAIDSVSMVVGELQDVVATTAIRHPRVPLLPSGRHIPMTAEDQIAISGTLPGGAVLSAHQRGGIASGAGFSMTVDGSDGTLEGTAPNHPHLTPITVRGARGHGRPTEMPLPDGYDHYPRLARSPIHTLAHVYAGIRDQFLGGPAVVPDFGDAVVRHQLLDAITRSAASGRRVQR